jgi:UPF0148 protein
MPEENGESVKRMAELLRKGATMLAEACPQCGSPLFKIDDDLYCAHCDRPVVVVESEDQIQTQSVKELIPELREKLVIKLQTVGSALEQENDIESLTKIANLMVLLLQALHRLQHL